MTGDEWIEIVVYGDRLPWNPTWFDVPMFQLHFEYDTSWIADIGLVVANVGKAPLRCFGLQSCKWSSKRGPRRGIAAAAILANPGGKAFGKILGGVGHSVDELSKAARAPSKNGFTEAGRAACEVFPV